MARITKIEATRTAHRKKLRVAAYARVSTNREHQLASLETQKKHYEKYIKARSDWEYTGLYFDEGISGTKMEKREGLLRLLEDCDKGLIDFIVVKSISRFSRNTVECIETVRKLCDKGIHIYFEKENIDTGKMEGELLLSILSSLAESESRSISDNINWGIQKRFRNGTFKIGYTPYGYDKGMVVNKEQAEVVKHIFASVLDGKSCRAIAKELNEKGIPTKRDGTWTGYTVNSMIKNEKYTGDAILQKTYTDERFNRHKNHGEKMKYHIVGHHEAIISHEVFDAANALITQNAMEKGIQKGTGIYRKRYAMSGKVICGECGGKMKRVKIFDHFGFACSKHIKDKTACGMKSIPEETVKTAFATMMNKLTFGWKIVLVPYADILKKSMKQESIDRLDEIETLLEKNAARRVQVAQFSSKGLIEPAVYAKESNVLTEEEKKLLEEKEKLAAQVNTDYGRREALENLLRYTAKGEVLTEFSDGLFTEHVDHVVIYEKTQIGFAMKCGPVFREIIQA